MEMAGRIAYKIKIGGVRAKAGGTWKDEGSLGGVGVYIRQGTSAVRLGLA
jgi:hypothetical protein